MRHGWTKRQENACHILTIPLLFTLGPVPLVTLALRAGTSPASEGPEEERRKGWTKKGPGTS